MSDIKYCQNCVYFEHKYELKNGAGRYFGTCSWGYRPKRKPIAPGSGFKEYIKESCKDFVDSDFCKAS